MKSNRIALMFIGVVVAVALFSSWLGIQYGKSLERDKYVQVTVPKFYHDDCRQYPHTGSHQWFVNYNRYKDSILNTRYVADTLTFLDSVKRTILLNQTYTKK